MRILMPFEYFEPGTVKEAVQICIKRGDGAKVLAGGLDLVPRLRKREITPECIVSIQRIPGLDYIKDDVAQGLRIGAFTKLHSIELSPLVQKNYAALYEAVHQIASVQVKTMGTAVGNLCVATPASDVAAALFALGAELRIAGTTAERTIPIEDFFVGVNQTVLQSGELVTEMLIPRPEANTGGVFLKLSRTATDVAKVNVAVVITVTNNTCQEARIALGSVAPTIIRARKAEGILEGQKLEPEIIGAAAEAAVEEIKPITDIRSTAEYRQETTRVLVRRAIQKAVQGTKR